MASWRPELHTPEDVLDYYNQFDSPYFRLYAGSKPESAYLRWDYTLNDKAKGSETLQDALISIKNNPNNNNTYLLQILMEEPKEPVGRKKGPKAESKNITFQLNAVDGIRPYDPAMLGMITRQEQDPAIRELVAQNKELIELLKSRLEEPVEEIEEPKGFLGGILSSPEMQPLIQAAIMGMISKFIPSESERPSINGIADVEAKNIYDTIPDIEEIVNRLQLCGMNVDDLRELSNYAMREKFMFKTWLSVLRTKFKK